MFVKFTSKEKQNRKSENLVAKKLYKQHWLKIKEWKKAYKTILYGKTKERRERRGVSG